jgi:hypothetical protein
MTANLMFGSPKSLDMPNETVERMLAVDACLQSRERFAASIAHFCC